MGRAPEPPVVGFSSDKTAQTYHLARGLEPRQRVDRLAALAWASRRPRAARPPKHQPANQHKAQFALSGALPIIRPKSI